MIEKIDVVEAMKRYGGSFIKSLAELILKADDINLQKIKNTWPEYWNRYWRIAKDNEKKE